MITKDLPPRHSVMFNWGHKWMCGEFLNRDRFTTGTGTVVEFVKVLKDSQEFTLRPEEVETMDQFAARKAAARIETARLNYAVEIEAINRGANTPALLAEALKMTQLKAGSKLRAIKRRGLLK